MNGWITGTGAVNKIILIKSALHRNRIKKLDEIYGAGSSSLHPIYSSFKYVSPEINSLVQAIELKRAGRICILDRDYLELVHNLYANLADLNLLAPQKDTYSVFTNILAEEPQAGEEFHLAISLIEEYGCWVGEMAKAVLYEIVPLKGRDGDPRPQVGFSDYSLLGSIFTGMYRSDFPEIDLSIAIAHEVGHQVLMLQQAGQTPISEGSFNQWIYSGVRKTERPAIAAFHAVIALAYMNEMYKGLLKCYHFNSDKERNYTESQFNTNNTNLIEGLEALKSIDLTKLGERIIQDIRTTL